MMATHHPIALNPLEEAALAGHKKGTNWSTLLVGPTGSGKTTQLWTIPGKKFAYLFDRNAIKTLEGCPNLTHELWYPERSEFDLHVQSIRKKVGTSGSGSVIRKGKPGNPHMYEDWVEDFNKKYDDGFFNKFDTIVIDGMTALITQMMRELKVIQDKQGREDMRTDYMIAGTVLNNVIGQLLLIDKNVMLMAHTRMIKDDLSKRIYHEFAMPGSARVVVPPMFDNVLIMHCRSNKDSELFVAQTRPDRENPSVRCAVRGCDMFEDMTVNDFRKPTQFGLGKLLQG